MVITMLVKKCYVVHICPHLILVEIGVRLRVLLGSDELAGFEFCESRWATLLNLNSWSTDLNPWQLPMSQNHCSRDLHALVLKRTDRCDKSTAYVPPKACPTSEQSRPSLGRAGVDLGWIRFQSNGWVLEH